MKKALRGPEPEPVAAVTSAHRCAGQVTDALQKCALHPCLSEFFVIL